MSTTHAFDNSYEFDWENSIILDYEDDFFNRGIQRHDMFNQDVGLTEPNRDYIDRLCLMVLCSL